MNIQEMAEILHVELNGIEKVQIERYIELYQKSKEEMFNEVCKEENWREIFIDLYIHLAVHTYERYKKLNIAEKVFFDTMSDITIWNRSCQKKAGRNGIEEYRWIEKSLDFKLFRLGRLQFEPIALQQDIILNEKKIEKGTIVYNVHIAEGEKLPYEKVQASYWEALRFFHGISNIFICDSWLLSPALRELLGEEANISQFQRDYKILFTDEESRQFEERVFGEIREDISSYPEDTSLQRKGKEYLLQKGKVGKATGAFQLLY